MKLFRLLMALTLLPLAFAARAQNFPVQANTQLVPPYSVYLSDYATAGNEKLRVILMQRDLTQPLYQLRLVMVVEWNGRVIMRTSRAFNPAPISLNPGIPTIISGAELAPYLDSRNIDFVGYNREQYEKTRSLPEGSYRISFTAYDYRRQDVQVSNEGSSFHYLTKNEPPLINNPVCGAIVPERMPQQLIFSWLPRNTAAPASAAETRYEFALYETRPAGRNPNDVVLTSQPVFKATVDYTQLIYGPAEPALIKDMVYVWRVRAIDINGRDAFRNNGYSEVCTFTYGGIDPLFNVGVPENLRAEGETERKGRIWWKKGDFDSYRVFYKKTGTGHEWFTSNIFTKDLPTTDAEAELKLFDLEPDTEYETRIQARKGNAPGPYTEIVKFRTREMLVGQCGDNADAPQPDMSRPFLNAIFGTLVEADDMELQMLNATHLGDGWYKGLGRVSIPYLGGAAFTVSFERLYIDDSRRAFGRIDFLTKGVAAMAEQQLASQKDREAERVKEANRQQWVGTDFHEKIFKYDEMVITDISINNGSQISITDNNGQVTGNTAIIQVLASHPTKAIIIEDKNGDQWVVQKDGETGEVKVDKVEGGGLSPAVNMELSAEANNIIKKALKQLRNEYSDKRIGGINTDLTVKRKTLNDHILKHNKSLRSEMTSYNTAVLPSESGSLFFDFEEGFEPDTETDKFDQLAKPVKEKELELNRALLIKYVGSDLDNKNDYKLVAASLEIDNKNITDYVNDAKNSNVPEADIISNVKVAIVELIDKIFIQYSVNN